MLSKDAILQALRELSQEHRELYGGKVDIIHNPVEPLHFYRLYVSTSKPCLIKGVLEEWKARHIWSNQYLSEKLGDREVAVVATPDGRADAISRLPGTGEEVFALPAEGSMTVSTLLKHFSSQQRGRNALYMQQQNDCLRMTFPELEGDIKPMLPWADTAFGCQPEAVNLWIGGRESITTFHKDHYENLFAVIRGAKTFYLLPPSDYYRLNIEEYPLAQYRAGNTTECLAACPLTLSKQQGQPSVSWSPVDPRSALEAKDSLASDSSLPVPIAVTVHEGEVLYLPSMWHHFVEQHEGPEGSCIAVNLWYDMVMDTKYAHYVLTEKLSKLCRQ